MSSGSGSSSTTVDKNLLPDYAQPYVQDFLATCYSLSLNGYDTYPDKTYADQDTNEADGIAALATRGRNGHAIISKGETLLRDIIDGLKINSNPKIDDFYLKTAEAIIQEFEEEILPRLDQEFNLSGNYGSVAHNRAQAKAAEKVMERLAAIGADIYFGDYMAERGYQSSSLGTVIAYGTQDVVNAELLRQAGLYAREYTQGSYLDQFKKWKDEQEAKVKRLEILGNSIRALVGAHVTKTEPYYRPSTLSQVARIALAGAGAIASMYSGTTPNRSPYSGGNSPDNLKAVDGWFGNDTGYAHKSTGAWDSDK